MDNFEREYQGRIHEALARELDLEDGQLLTGWVVVFETTSVSSSAATAGHFYGPEGMTTWRSLGLLEWSRRFCLIPDESGDDGK